LVVSANEVLRPAVEPHAQDRGNFVALRARALGRASVAAMAAPRDHHGRGVLRVPERVGSSTFG